MEKVSSITSSSKEWIDKEFPSSNSFADTIFRAIGYWGTEAIFTTFSRGSSLVKHTKTLNFSEKGVFKTTCQNAKDGKVKKRSRLNKMEPHPEAGGPHSSFKRGASGRISGYDTYNWNPSYGWTSKLRFRGEGKPHGGIHPPVILEKKTGKKAGSKPVVPRKPRKPELPYGYE